MNEIMNSGLSWLTSTNASWLLAGLGSFFLLTGSIGLIRMPTFYTRIHACGLIDSLGALFIFLSLAIYTGWGMTSIKILIIIILLLITAPAAIHALGKTARHHTGK